MSNETDLLRDEELALLEEMTEHLSFALQYRQREDHMEFLAYFDPLTGLAKRTLFCERVDKLLHDRLGPKTQPTLVACYLHSRPVPLAGIEKLLTAGPKAH